MIIQVNGTRQDFNDTALSVRRLIELNKVESPDLVSVQLNGEFVERDDFSGKLLHDGDSVDFLYFMGGGTCERIYN
ncbi:MAG: thiamine biosynthesis protein ThiS [Spirochaetes bacterium GWF1_51_8]|nr:MAG: thiamine biosynthesis protein ThiS [Spirochaetes bacterium GWF1_51_8]